MNYLCLPLLLSLSLPVAAQEWALGGYDPVGYAQQGHATPGRNDIATMWRGKVWHFASEENRQRFESNPRSFVPAFDGNCPVALAEGRKQNGDPRHFAVVGGQLYLLQSDSAERRLRQSPEQVIDRARDVWAALR
ncbi:YHS domain-containing (seleno)protein [Paracoccus sp. (in: a-proteobacteria)]|uniref:YHS domain-containing (seleno)protein n=1 Tax=Paracoccus sp. TaxID=267 RepID=UPI0026E0F107|nr:YHS domain-containing (seleno)protein [Paracoccus sp. (in: a-proteobacteria)]MDO5647301.1 YHS domain-containing (seleno)protein [Paracoccus sp. (in: a-proteobacteria)]